LYQLFAARGKGIIWWAKNKKVNPIAT